MSDAHGKKRPGIKGKSRKANERAHAREEQLRRKRREQAK